MDNGKINVAIVGCGNIATRYAAQIQSYENIRLLGFADIVLQRAEEFTKEYGGKLYSSLDDVLADPNVDVVVNLTIHHAHPEVIAASLKAGKHVHTEKPLAMSYAEAKSLVQLAENRELRLSSAPITYMGEAQQTAWKVIREGQLGKIRLTYAEVNHGRIETWHPNPEPFFDVGVLWDVSVYPLTILTAIFGPATRVQAFGNIIHPHRTTIEGREFTIETPDFVVALIDFESGPVVRLTANFYAKGSKQGGALEFHGDRGRLYLGNFQGFSAPVEFAPFGEEYETVPFIREPYEGIEFGRGIEDLADAILKNRPHRAAGAHAAHVVEIVEGIQNAMKSGKPVRLSSDFDPPLPMDWA